VDGFRVFKFSEDVQIPYATLVQTFRPKLQKIHGFLQCATYMNSCKWIGPASSDRALAVKFTDTAQCEDVVQIFGNVGNNDDKLDVLRVVHTTNGGMAQFDACCQGRMAVVMGQLRELHLFKLCAYGTIEHKRACMQLYMPNKSEDVKIYTYTALSLSDRLAVVGYHFPQFPEGVVDVFSSVTCRLMARRLVPCGVPTALSTKGEQVLVGISDWCTSPPADEDAFGNATSASALYTFNAQSCENVGIYKGEHWHPVWPARSICLGSGEWCYARTGVGQTSGKRVTVIDHAILQR
tara:strand:+ start:5390 stop:6271 length:882 start_codon:yes stop_codon:yes gene_type:complete